MQPGPEHRSTLYPVTPTLSVEAVQDKLTCVVEAAVAVRFVGALGALVSGAAGVASEKTFEYPLLFPAASTARTLYEYEVDAANPESLKAVATGVAICAKFAQPAPEHRSTLYPVTPTLSVDAIQERPICVANVDVAVKLAGAVGGVVSGGGAEAELPSPLHPASIHAHMDAKTVK